MLTVAVELSKALVAGRNGDEFPPLQPGAACCSYDLDCDAVFARTGTRSSSRPAGCPRSSHSRLRRHPLSVLAEPARRRADAPPAAVYVHDLAFRLRPAEVHGSSAHTSAPSSRRR